MSKNHYRAPVVVVLGHVDHGKTTLLDYIRKTRKAEREVGGITQKIGAYEVEVEKKEDSANKITFIDTPGHEAFTKLRLHGATVADIAILVISAVDSVQPQTIESISHIKNAAIPFIVAVNKTDLPGANIDKVKKDLIKHEVLVEGVGGDVPIVSISAKTGAGVTDLLETIIFLGSMSEFHYTPTAPAQAYIIEAGRDKSGVIVSAIIKEGTIRVGDTIYSGNQEAKVRALLSDDGVSLKEVIPSTPFIMLGFKEVPEPGTQLTSTKITSEVVDQPQSQPLTNTEIGALFGKKDDTKKLKLIIRADSQGSLEALLSILQKNEAIEIVLATVGEIAKSDIFLAKVSEAIIIGFSVPTDKIVLQLAKEEKVIIKTYKIIYELLDELTEVSTLLTEKQAKAKSLKGEAKVLATFIIDQEQIAGLQVIKGKMAINDTIELWRGDRLIKESKIVSLRQRAKTVQEIKKNEECGALFYPKLDFMVGDMVKSYSI